MLMSLRNLSTHLNLRHLYMCRYLVRFFSCSVSSSFRKTGTCRNCQVEDVLLNMLKTKKVTPDLRQIRLKAKRTSAKGIPSTISLHVLGNGAVGCPRCLYMSTSQERYIFNCGEGTQRVANEHKLKISKLEHIFVTHKSWENLGGFPGMSLTVQDIGVPSITLHGPPCLTDLYEKMQVFMDVRDLKVVYRSYTEKPFVDSCMKVEYVPLIRNSSDRDNSDSPVRKKCKTLENEETDISVAYICKCHNKPGQLLLHECVLQGVPPGPLLGQLKNGQDVTLADGRIVRSQDVVAPEEPGPVFIVLECPSVEYIDSLLAEKKFEPHQSHGASPTDCASVVVHFTELDVISDSRYQEWMNRFPASTFHLLLNTSNSTLSSIAVHQIQHKLHLIHPTIFPLLKDRNHLVSSIGSNTLIVQADNLTSFALRPKDGLNRETAVNLDVETFIQEAYAKPNFSVNLKELQSKLSEINGTAENETTVEEYPEIAFLGTGSCIPSKVRNVSGILTNVSSLTSILLDCGEGTYSQLCRLYGSEQMKNVMKKISCIFVSHLHADHHLGLVQLLKARKEILSDEPTLPLHVIAPFRVIHWLNNYSCSFEDLLEDVSIIPNADLAYGKYKESKVYDQLISKLGLSDICTVPVLHCKDAYGIVFTTNQNYKVVYSGDTMPCEELVKAGQKCSLLIHEATMEDNLEEEARIKTHSTTSQAIDVSKRMNAQFTILTHFSQRYAKLPLFPNEDSEKIGFAFDNMVVRPCDLKLLPHFLPTLKSLFAEHYEEMKERTEKRLRQKQLMEEALQQVKT